MDETRPTRRKLLAYLTASIAAIGAALSAIPFVRSALPSARTRALGDPIKIDINGIRPGELRALQWRGRTIWILHRTEEMLATLEETEAKVMDRGKDVEYVDSRFRSIDPKYLVVDATCTHFGCVPNPSKRGASGMGDWWPGGFQCPCHISGYDYSGRVVKGPAPRNLKIPPHRYASDHEIIIGESPTES